MNKIFKKNWKDILFYGTVFTAMLFFVLLQPLGEPPDESGRYKIVQYICLNGTLPHGADPDILLYGYGGSYGYQPILTYIIQGYLIRFLFRFTQDGYLLLLAARMVNVMFGMIMAVYVRKISKAVFGSRTGQEDAWGWLFSVTVMLLPQSLFLHTYINTDSMAMMSTAIMLYAWIKGLEKDWDMASCITLSAGISLCALSYYNAYGFILCSILLFLASFLQKEAASGGKWRLRYKLLLQKGIFISSVVLLCISWWFIRNAVLYDGDFLGLTARAECTLLTASEQFHPLTKVTYQNQGYSLWDMLLHSDFIELLTTSSIATFGPMSIVTFQHIYTIFKWFFLLAGLGFFLIPAGWPDNGSSVGYSRESNPQRFFFKANLMLCILIPLLLCVFYSYASDYQPQGRYILPMLLPFCLFLVSGTRKLTGAGEKLILQAAAKKTVRQDSRINLTAAASRLPQIIVTAITLFYLYALWSTLIFIVFPVYYESSILYYLRH